MAEKLRDKIISLLNKMQGTRKNLVKDKFNRIAVIPPSKICIENYIRTKPHAAFNPGAILVNDEIHMFPRLIFDYYKYTSCIGHLTMKMSDLYELNQREKVSTKIIMTPTYLWEFKGCEDPRIFKHNEKYIFFYTGYGYEWVDNKLETRIRQGIAWLDSNFNVEKRAYLRFKDDHKYYYYPTKDSTIISMSNNKARILTRPSIMDLEVGWKTEIDLNDPVVNINKLEPVLWFEEWETHVGWSTNTVKISSNEYLVGWHGCSRTDLAYRNGLAVVNGEGELIGITDYLLSPRGLVETFGDRPYVIFGDGLILVKDQLLWIGGISDYAIGIFETEINQVFENMKWLSG